MILEEFSQTQCIWKNKIGVSFFSTFSLYFLSSYFFVPALIMETVVKTTIAVI